MAHSSDVSIDIMDQALSAHVKILDYRYYLKYPYKFYAEFNLDIYPSLIRTKVQKYSISHFQTAALNIEKLKRQDGYTDVLKNLKSVLLGYYLH